ncbi:MAG: DJ-1/PfpI family protein [Elusimicrobia bacterium]|nr:DJ-1/PfpI family protein [Elusimicrobiota bacterium]
MFPLYSRKVLAIGLLLLSLPGLAGAAGPKKVLMMISEGFWAPEYYEPRAAYDKAGFQVTVAAKYSDPVRPDRRNWDKYKPVKPDVTFDKVKAADYDAITAAGGNGAWEDLFPNDDVHRIVTESFKEKKLTALLCSSTGLLGVVNNFNGDGEPVAAGRHVTGYYRVEGLLRKMGRVNYDPGQKDKPYVVVDGDLITGRDPMSASLFGETVANRLKESR